VEREAWERVSRVEVENAVALASAREDAEGLVWKAVVLKGELMEAREAREVAEEKSRGLFNAVADAERQWEVSEKGAGSTLRSSSIYRLKALSHVLPLSALHG
jgi:hypothetical protein